MAACRFENILQRRHSFGNPSPLVSDDKVCSKLHLESGLCYFGLVELGLSSPLQSFRTVLSRAYRPHAQGSLLAQGNVELLMHLSCNAIHELSDGESSQSA